MNSSKSKPKENPPPSYFSSPLKAEFKPLLLFISTSLNVLETDRTLSVMFKGPNCVFEN